MGKALFVKDKFIVTQDIGKNKKIYYTVIKNKGLGKKNPHAHFNNYKAAKIALHFANKEYIPKKYKGYMRAAIQRLIDG